MLKIWYSWGKIWWKLWITHSPGGFVGEPLSWKYDFCFRVQSTNWASNDIIAGNGREKFMIELKIFMKCLFKVTWKGTRLESEPLYLYSCNASLIVKILNLYVIKLNLELLSTNTSTYKKKGFIDTITDNAFIACYIRRKKYREFMSRIKSVIK